MARHPARLGGIGKVGRVKPLTVAFVTVDNYAEILRGLARLFCPDIVAPQILPLAIII
jgi:hypothetical protein